MRFQWGYPERENPDGAFCDQVGTRAHLGCNLDAATIALSVWSEEPGGTAVRSPGRAGQAALPVSRRAFDRAAERRRQSANC